MGTYDFALAIGGEAGQGIATPGDILARIIVRRGLHLSTYNSYQSIVRGGHIFLTMRISDAEVQNHGDKLDLLICLNQDTMDRHQRLMGPDTRIVYNSDTVNPGTEDNGADLCGFPLSELTDSRNRLIQNTVAMGVTTALMGIDFSVLEESLALRFERQGQEMVDQNVSVAKAGFDYAKEHFRPFEQTPPTGEKQLAVWAGNEAMAMGGAAAGVKFYAAYPMSPSTGVLHWMASNARNLGIMVRQVEDEIGVANMVLGAGQSGTRSMCATSGGGFALMTEAVGAAAMMEIPAVFIDVQRAGPSTGVPTKTEQGDLWQALGASQGDFERIIVTPTDCLDAFNTMAEVFNLTDKYQCPGIVISDLYISEGRFSVDPDKINMHPKIDRGQLITEGSEGGEFLRYKDTESGISPRPIAGLEGYVHVAPTDEHDEDSTLLSDEFTNPHKRRAMVEKRARKFDHILDDIAPPVLRGPAGADVTLVGWGSTDGIIAEAVDALNAEGISVNHLQIKWMVPFHGDNIMETLSKSKRTIIVENNFSGQFARYLRSETGFAADGHIRKYDGEPFMPHHIVDGVKAQIKGETTKYVPYQEITV
ncbi:MAG: 2-oxoacid:acceptor oxidoreductase subunit alpha [SAR202 cluster bacterium]|nr:2-oxoacid:acceptor oxidoreductase subunit alpha [Chloroflexota bacterium]MQG34437.1 2-oxoacid:acceptor oxidoreductase subunit alpha [SAR202 cluster bacterium]HCP24425.1 2-oxoacid:acceptor oxidoreductase subunit alpha [Dehalococcoidia bacterium]